MKFLRFYYELLLLSSSFIYLWLFYNKFHY